MKVIDAMSRQIIGVTLIVAILGGGCAANKLHESEAGPDGSRIYRTSDGDTLRVDSDGKVYGYPGNKRFGSGEHGVAAKVGAEWDMSPFNVKPASEGCETLFPLFPPDDAVKRYHSCWNRVWEIPAFVIALPIAIIVVAFNSGLGIVIPR